MSSNHFYVKIDKGKFSGKTSGKEKNEFWEWTKALTNCVCDCGIYSLFFIYTNCGRWGYP